MSVLLETSLGDIVVDLYCEKCPLATKNFLKLCKMKFYNNALFFDVQKNYITRVLDHTKPPTCLNELLYGEQAKYFDDEIYPDLKHNKYGLVSTSNKAPNMNNSEFFITLTNENIEFLNGKHTIFGCVAEGLDILEKINQTYIDETNRPFKNIRILHTMVLDDPFPDPEELVYPSKSPERVKNIDDRLEIDEEIDILEKDGRTEEELLNATKEHEAKTKAIVLEMINDLPDADIKPPDNVLFVCKLNPATQEKDLELIFSKFGTIRKYNKVSYPGQIIDKINSCEVIRDWKTGQSLQYAFIEFETNAACEEAYFKMENSLIDERRIHIDFSQSVAKMWPKYRKDMRKKFEEEAKNKQNITEVELKQKPRTGDEKYKFVFDNSKKGRNSRSGSASRKKRHRRDRSRSRDSSSSRSQSWKKTHKNKKKY